MSSKQRDAIFVVLCLVVVVGVISYAYYAKDRPGPKYPMDIPALYIKDSKSSDARVLVLDLKRARHDLIHGFMDSVQAIAARQGDIHIQFTRPTSTNLHRTLYVEGHVQKFDPGTWLLYLTDFRGGEVLPDSLVGSMVTQGEGGSMSP